MNARVLLLASLFGGLSIITANAQTITAPVGQSLVIANPVNVTGGSVNIPIDSAFKIAGKSVLSNKGFQNLFLGEGTGNSGANNVFIGKSAGSITTGSGNLFLGSFAGSGNSSGYSNTFIGVGAGEQNTAGGNNVCIGAASGHDNGSGNFNTFIGGSSGRFSNGANGNSFFGNSSGYYTSTGGNNSGLGLSSGQDNTTGSQNTFVGASSGGNNTTGSQNTYLGYGTNSSSASLSNVTVIGYNAQASASNSVVLGNNANVGIGNSAPSDKLEITAAAGTSGLKFTSLTTASTVASSTPAVGAKVLSVDATGKVILVGLTAPTPASVSNPIADANWKSQDGYLYNNSTKGIVVGRGVSSMPEGYSIYATEGILTEKAKVAVKNTEDWADYVFKPTYKRLSLEEVGKFIAINNHLPNVPSAAEMVANGNDLHKTDVKLLEKIEELIE
jgi:hypothetical protein